MVGAEHYGHPVGRYLHRSDDQTFGVELALDVACNGLPVQAQGDAIAGRHHGVRRCTQHVEGVSGEPLTAWPGHNAQLDRIEGRRHGCDVDRLGSVGAWADHETIAGREGRGSDAAEHVGRRGTQRLLGDETAVHRDIGVHAALTVSDAQHFASTHDYECVHRDGVVADEHRARCTGQRDAHSAQRAQHESTENDLERDGVAFVADQAIREPEAGAVCRTRWAHAESRIPWAAEILERGPRPCIDHLDHGAFHETILPRRPRLSGRFPRPDNGRTPVGETFAEEGRLIGWLAAHLPGATDFVLDDFRRPQGSGFSAETQIFTARYRRDGAVRTEMFVVRRETPDPAVYPRQAPGFDVEIDIQYRVMAALHAHSSVPLAGLVGYEHDASLLGAPFFVMEFVDGVVPIENPLYTTEGFFVDATPEQRRTMVVNGLRTLSQIHAVDFQKAGLGWLVPSGVSPGTARQLDLWEGYARRELDDRRHPLFDEAVAWLRARVPEDPLVCLCWGDPRPGNVIWRDFAPVCVTDFEAVSVASPDQDLGWWLMFDHWVHETSGVARLEGEPTRDEQRAIYAGFTGRDIPNTTFHEIFAATRYAAIVVRVMNRAVGRGLMPADHTVWLQNPATVCLEHLLSKVR